MMPIFFPLRPLPLALPAPRALVRWRVEYRWTHKGTEDAGRSVLEFLARGEREARALALRVVDEASRVLGQAAFRIEIGEVGA